MNVVLPMTYFSETQFPFWKLTVTTFFTLEFLIYILLNLEFFWELYFLPYLFIYSCAGLCCSWWAFSLVVVRQGYFSYCARTHCGGFSCCWAQTLGPKGFSSSACGLYSLGSIDLVQGLSCPLACGILVPGLGIRPMYLALDQGFLTTGPPEQSLQFRIFKP